MFDPELSSPKNIGSKVDFDRLKHGTNAIAFFVNGFGGCAPCITRSLHQNLQLQNIDVCDLDWNDIYLRKQSVYLKFSDSSFINNMVKKVIPSIASNRKIIAIGHSLGANALLEVARKIAPRKIAFLGTLDAVGGLGLRSNRSVSANVEYFYNRWTKHPSLPRNVPAINIRGTKHRIGIAFDAYRSGELRLESSFTYNNQQEQSYASAIAKENLSTNIQPKILTHGCQNAIYQDLYLQQQMFDIIQKII